MIWSFGDKANLTPFTVQQPAQSLSATNPAGKSSVVTAGTTKGIPDRVDSAKLNQEIWESATGRSGPMPQPQHRLSAGAVQDGDG